MRSLNEMVAIFRRRLSTFAVSRTLTHTQLASDIDSRSSVLLERSWICKQLPSRCYMYGAIRVDRYIVSDKVMIDGWTTLRRRLVALSRTPCSRV